MTEAEEEEERESKLAGWPGGLEEEGGSGDGTATVRKE